MAMILHYLLKRCPHWASQLDSRLRQAYKIFCIKKKAALDVVSAKYLYIQLFLELF